MDIKGSAAYVKEAKYFLKPTSV